jgi:hypothetical protein
MIEHTNIHTQTITNQSWNAGKHAFDFSFVFAFRNREEYLAFRRLWKENYAALSGTIRSHKSEAKATMRKHEYAGKLQNKVHELKREATKQLLMLREAKQEANRQYLAARQATP